MSILSSAHTHTPFCDGKTPPEDMIRRALELGFVSLGFSSHAAQTFDPDYCIAPDRQEAYRAAILSLRDAYAGRIPIYLGIERDLFSCADAAAYDYFIASVHYFLKPDGHHTAVDGNAADLGKYADEHCGGDGLRVAAQYFSMLRDYVLQSRPAIIGHFDLLRKNNAVLHLIDEDSPAYRRLALDALRPLCETGALLEVNTGAMGRGYLSTPYPAAFLLREWLNWGGEVIVNSDCHDMRFLDCGYREAEALLLSLGYRHAVRLGRREMWERFTLA